MKARSDEKIKSRNTRSKASANRSPGGQQSAGSQDRVQASQPNHSPRGRDDSSIRGRESGQVRGENAGASDQDRESAIVVRDRKSSGNKKLLRAVPIPGRRAPQISCAPVNAIRNKKTEGA